MYQADEDFEDLLKDEKKHEEEELKKLEKEN